NNAGIIIFGSGKNNSPSYVAMTDLKLIRAVKASTKLASLPEVVEQLVLAYALPDRFIRELGYMFQSWDYWLSDEVFSQDWDDDLQEDQALPDSQIERNIGGEFLKLC